MNRCTKCLAVDSRPDTAFEDGVCSACIAYERRNEIDWGARKKELEFLLNKHSHGTYDCIVPSSGGKDSTWQVLTLIEMGAKPLVITAQTCHLTDIGRRNINNLARYADTWEICPNKEVRRKLNRISLEMLGDISWPEHVLIHTVPFTIAQQTGITLVFYGENPLNQYGGPNQGRQREQRMTRRWVSEFGGFLGMRPQDFVGLEGITEDDMAAYAGPTDIELKESGVEVYFLGQFLPWDSRKNAKLAIKSGFETKLPCESNWWDFENLDNAQTGLHDYMMFRKYGYGRACAQLSVDIRTGHISRERGLQILNEREHIFPEMYAGVWCDEMLGRIGVTRNNLYKTIDQFTNWDLFRRVVDDETEHPIRLA